MKWWDEVTPEDVGNLIGFCFSTVKDQWDKEREMEFDRSRVYTSLNADELRAGDMVIVANNLRDLKEFVQGYSVPVPLDEIIGERWTGRFRVEGDSYALAYLVERAENCTNCQDHEYCGFVQNQSRFANLNRCENYKPKTEPKASEICINCEYYSTGYCNRHDKPTRYDNICPDFLLYEPKTEQKAEDKWCKNCGIEDCTRAGVYDDIRCPAWQPRAEKHYRPFRDTDELIKVWAKRKYSTDSYAYASEMSMPLIWVKYKNHPSDAKFLITTFEIDKVWLGASDRTMQELFDKFDFLDGSPCGVEE